MAADMNWRHIILRGHGLRTSLATLAAGGLGGLGAMWAGVPLGMLLGSMVTVAVIASCGVRFAGRPPALPMHWRMVMLPMVGTAIGGSVTPQIGEQLLRWWPSMVMVLPFVMLAHFMGYQIYRRIGRIDPVTAYFSAMPGGYLEALEMGEKRGADMQMLIMLQLLRLMLCIIMVPLAFTFFSGHAVGSAAGAQMPGANLPMSGTDMLVLAICAWGGLWLGLRVGAPAAVIMGPLVLSAIAHATGLVAASPPGWTITLVQWVVGTSFGVRFAGLNPARLGLGLALGLVSVTATLILALLMALVLVHVQPEPVPAVILAFAPGGVTEMALVAISLELAVVYVTLSHLVRILMTVAVARLGMRFLPPPSA